MCSIFRQSKSIAVTSMAFPNNEINNFVLGSEDGLVYSGCRHGTRSGIGESYEKHLGPVTGVSTHYNQSSPDFGHLFLTSSIDWTIKLWSLKVIILIFVILCLSFLLMHSYCFF